MVAYASLVEGDMVRVTFLNESGVVKRVVGIDVDVMTLGSTFIHTRRQYVKFLSRPQKVRERMAAEQATPKETTIRIAILGEGETRRVGIIASRGDVAYTHTQPAAAEVDWNAVVNDCIAGLTHIEATGLPDIQTSKEDTVGGAPEEPKKASSSKKAKKKKSMSKPVSVSDAAAPRITPLVPPRDVATKQKSLF